MILDYYKTFRDFLTYKLESALSNFETDITTKVIDGWLKQLEEVETKIRSLESSSVSEWDNLPSDVQDKINNILEEYVDGIEEK